MGSLAGFPNIRGLGVETYISANAFFLKKDILLVSSEEGAVQEEAKAKGTRNKRRRRTKEERIVKEGSSGTNIWTKQIGFQKGATDAEFAQSSLLFSSFSSFSFQESGENSCKNASVSEKKKVQKREKFEPVG